MLFDIFVFGSNLAGRHGLGAAAFAVKYFEAIPGNGLGIQGNSYAIPTKNYNMKPLPLKEIQVFINTFIAYANLFPLSTFLVTRIGCGYAKYLDSEIAPLFQEVPSNCFIPKSWSEYIDKPTNTYNDRTTNYNLIATNVIPNPTINCPRVSS